MIGHVRACVAVEPVNPSPPSTPACIWGIFPDSLATTMGLRDTAKPIPPFAALALYFRPDGTARLTPHLLAVAPSFPATLKDCEGPHLPSLPHRLLVTWRAAHAAERRAFVETLARRARSQRLVPAEPTYRGWQR